MSRRRSKIFWVILLITLICTTSVKSYAHNHADGKRHNDCLLCNFEKTLFSIDLTEVVSISLEFIPFENIKNRNILPFFYILTHSIRIRPPPASSI